MHSPTLNIGPSARIFGLDLFRTFAIISVMMFHGGPLLVAAKTRFPWIPMGDGVGMFFVLSGYLIGGILIKEFIVPSRLGFSELLHFLKRRWYRTLPNYYLILGANILLAYMGWNLNKIEHFDFRFFLFAQNIAWSFEGFFWESWSLAVEEWFYLSFPLFLIVGMAFTRDAALRKWIFLGAVGFFLLIPTLLRIAHFSPSMDMGTYHLEVQKVVVYRLDNIAFGLMMACIAKFAPKFWRMIRWPSFIFGILLFGFISVYWEPMGTYYQQVWLLSLHALAYTCWLPLLSQWTKIPEWIARPIRHISLISYSMYLVHLALICDVIQRWWMPTTPMESWISYTVYFAVTIAISTVLYYSWERPMMNLRDR